MQRKKSIEHGKIYDVVTVGERGQVVIPVSARRDLDIKAGDKLVVMRAPVGAGFVSMKLSELYGFMERISDGFGKIKKTVEKGS